MTKTRPCGDPIYSQESHLWKDCATYGTGLQGNASGATYVTFETGKSGFSSCVTVKSNTALLQ